MQVFDEIAEKIILGLLKKEMFLSPDKRDIRCMMNNNEYDLNQRLLMVWGRFYHPSCTKRNQ
jgi:hypothetical protein